jgi:antitoxin CptB
MSPDDAAELRRLRWRCRRGMRELDRILERYLDQRWSAAEPSERALFEHLLDCEDDQLWRWFLSRSKPEDPDLIALVDSILENATN